MQFFRLLFGRPKKRQNKQEKRPAHESKTTVSVVIVQIDIGNVASYTSRTNWDALREAIKKDCRGVRPYRAYAYRRVERGAQRNKDFLDRATLSWEQAGYRFSPNIVKGKDIDMPLAADLTFWLDELLERHDEVNVRLILASGDGDFTPFIKNKRRVYKDRLRIELIVYSWVRGLSPALNELAGPGNLRFLDDIEGYRIQD